MEEEEGFDHMEEGGFMELLGSGGEEGYLFDAPSSLSSPSSSCYSSLTAAQMLCFGGKEEGTLPLHGVLGQKSSDNSSLSSLSSSPPSPITTNINNNSSSKISKKKVVSGGGRRTTSETTTSTMLSTSKKPKTEGSASAVVHGTIKVRKEKLGDRIMALQQLVSPFGKSDTASVLHEALGYIRFLHDQVQVLSSPYLQGLPSSDHIQDVGESDLRSRGLCLVPISCTEHVTSSNGADLWSPAMGSSKSSSSFKH